MQLEELITQFQRKDEKAFEALYKMYSKSMQGVIYNIVRDNDIAECTSSLFFQNCTSFSAISSVLFSANSR